MEVFLAYKQFCNIKDVLSKSYDTLSFEDQLKMYNPFILTLNEILGSEYVKIEQEGGAAAVAAVAGKVKVPKAPEAAAKVKEAVEKAPEAAKPPAIVGSEVPAVKVDKPKEEESFKDFFKALKNAIIEIFVIIKRMFMAVVLFFVYASLYPAIPFFGVLSAGLATFKYILFKFRKL